IRVFAIGTIFSAAVAGVFGNWLGVWNGLQAAAISLGAVWITLILRSSRSNSAGVGLILALVLAETAYACVQLFHLRFDVGPVSWSTLGNATRWWDSRALYGTFALSGNKSFGNSLVLFGAIVLPFALMGPSRRL